MSTVDVTTNDLQQIRYVTQNYGKLQGLRWVPFGVALLVATPLYAGWQFAQSGVMLTLWLLPLAIGFGGYWLVGRYYAHTFGQVQPVPRSGRNWREQIVIWPLLWLAILLPQRGSSSRIALALMSLAVLASILFYLRRSGNLRLRRHWLVLSVVLTAVNLALLLPLPLLRPDRWSSYTLLAIWVASIGLGMIVGGLLDHLLLLRTLGTPTEEAHGSTV